MSTGLRRAATLLGRARTLVVSTGAGMSRESGIPTFRDAQDGLWARFNPEELATETGFRAAPARVWAWYAQRRRRILACEPHAGHRALVELEPLFSESVIVTQNIDGLHQAAGSAEVIELHGSIRRSRCLERGHPYEGEPAAPPAAGAEQLEEEPPLCAACGSPVRPDVVWFGEMLPAAATERAWKLATRCDAMLVVGTSGMVWPAAELPYVAARAGASIVEVNPVPSELTRIADVFLPGAAGEILPELVRSLQGERASVAQARSDDPALTREP